MNQIEKGTGTEPPESDAIRITDLEFRYGEEFCLRTPELRVQCGSKLAVIGPSGSGKTTLLNLIAGIALPLSGRIVTDGVEVSRLGESARRDFRVRKIGLVFQEFELLEYLNVLDNILLPFRISPALVLDEAVRERAVTLALGVGVGDKLRRRAARLSQGERQRVGVCRALLTRPTLVLADEPTGNLDPANKGRVLDILLDYVEASDATLVTVTHDRDLLGHFGRVIDLEEFSIAESGSSSSGGVP